ncbi:VPLPA-CTERM sorting domain-containing protein [Octadecabacter sp.]|nr:VPLPA-CTERM sorting domain-containing protein [Octadecabacter sp.]
MKHLLTTAAVIAATAIPAHSATLTETFTSFFAFGDSLTDDGKLGRLNAPSLGGRFSNGRVYAEIIADEFDQSGGDTGNLALGGATASDVNPNAFSALSTFTGQIATFAGALATGTPLPTSLVVPTDPSLPGPDTGDNPLLSVFFGANDFFNAVDPFVPQDFVALASSTADAVTDGIRDLAALGPQFDDFLVVGLPDISDTPAFFGSQLAFDFTNDFNERLLGNIGELEDDDLNITFFDSDAVFQDVIASVEDGSFEFGITDATSFCTASFNGPDPGTSCLDDGINPDTLLFGDSVHPSGSVQALFADRVLAQLDAELNPVPLPASMSFLLLGLAGFGAARFRKTKQA